MDQGTVLKIEWKDCRLTLVKGNRHRVEHVGKSTKKVKHNGRSGELRGLRRTGAGVIAGLLMDDNRKMGWFNAEDLVPDRESINA